MRYEEYAERFLEHRRVGEVRAYAHIMEGGKRYPLLLAETPGRRTLIITAGFHGDESAGPLTLLRDFPEIAAHAARRDVGLKVYPCLNPSGLEDNTRYNRSGEQPNNDFLRYELTPDNWVGELTAGQTFVGYRLFDGGPKETRALRASLEALPTPDAALDIHQDPYMDEHLSYAYNFGDNAPYRPMLAATNALLPLAMNLQVDDDVHTDADGLIQLHDGSITDYFWRRGVPYTAALETTTSAPAEVCHQVNMIWIKGFIDLAADR